MDLELCIASYESAFLAQKYRFKRVELCSALDLGGLTPSPGLISAVSALEGIETHVMIRPRAGNFCYSTDEIRIMKDDIRQVKELGGNGVVFGVLDPHKDPDMVVNGALTELAHTLGLEVTFHRAFDLVNDPVSALEELIQMGADRLLTSGQQSVAIEGISLIRELIRIADGRIQIMAGSGISHENVLEFKASGADAIHFTARKTVSETEHPGMGKSYEPDPLKIEKILNILSTG